MTPPLWMGKYKTTDTFTAFHYCLFYVKGQKKSSPNIDQAVKQRRMNCHFLKKPAKRLMCAPTSKRYMQKYIHSMITTMAERLP